MSESPKKFDIRIQKESSLDGLQKLHMMEIMIQLFHFTQKPQVKHKKEHLFSKEKNSLQFSFMQCVWEKEKDSIMTMRKKMEK